jgi:hypothetical protein
MQLFSNNCSRLSIMGKTEDANYGNVNTSKVIRELTETDHKQFSLGILSKL